MKCLQEGYGCEDVAPRGFVSLMDLYESNFIRIRKLIPELMNAGVQVADSTLNASDLKQLVHPYSVSRVAGCLDLHCHILEQTRYTTTFVLTYYFADSYKESRSDKTPVLVAEPQLRCRAYHDAGLVEVLTGHLLHGRQRYDALPANAVRVKWRLNRLLYKWLGFSLYLGHQFSHFDEQPEAFVFSHVPQIVNL